jgi:hypothetical protein
MVEKLHDTRQEEKQGEHRQEENALLIYAALLVLQPQLTKEKSKVE